MPWLREIYYQKLSMGKKNKQMSESNLRNGDLEKEFT